jgi:serine phosphatase RsbU (regulator of sigma subunit)
VIGPADILNADILVVDDKEANLRLIEGMLRVAGYTSVHSTADPRSVCELHRKNRYSLILLDLQMPGMDGFAVMEGLREIEAGGYLPVLVITAQPAHKLRALEAGAKDFVSKPFDFAELRARVHNILEVRLLHTESKNYSAMLEATVRELEESRETIRIQTLAEQKRSEAELALAQQTQQSLLPRELPQFENFRIRAFNSPTRYVGGDFYDFLRMDSGEWMGVLADVSGKGIPAALLSSMVLGALGTEFRAGTRTGEALNRVNGLLLEKSLEFQFVTLFILMLSPDGQGEFISAGHNPAYLFRSRTGVIETLTSEHFILGLLDYARYQPRALRLDEGDVLVVYSDGLTEAQDPHGADLGEERLLELIRREAPRGAQALELEMLKALAEFTQSSQQNDDITFVIVERRDPAVTP